MSPSLLLRFSNRTGRSLPGKRASWVPSLLQKRVFPSQFSPPLASPRRRSKFRRLRGPLLTPRQLELEWALVGITYGGLGLTAAPRFSAAIAAHVDLSEPAPVQLEALADATWGDRNIYGVLVTFGGGAILHQTKKLALVVDSSMEAEAIASCKAAECISYARDFAPSTSRSTILPSSAPTTWPTCAWDPCAPPPPEPVTSCVDTTLSFSASPPVK